jgi:hypothetical protein
MLNYIILSMFSMISSAYSSETHIDFESVDVSANSVGPSLQAIVERKTQTEFDPYKFEELCSESNEVIKKKNDISLRLIEGSGILHEEPLLQPGKYRTCIMNNIDGEMIHFNYELNVKSDKKNGMRVYDDPKINLYDCSDGVIRTDPFGRSKVTNHSGDCDEEAEFKIQDMFFEGLTSFNVTLLYPDLFELERNVMRNFRKYNLKSRYCGSSKEHCSHELPKLAVARLKRVKDNKVVYIGFDKESVTIERKHLIFYMNQQSWLFYMEKIDE